MLIHNLGLPMEYKVDVVELLSSFNESLSRVQDDTFHILHYSSDKFLASLVLVVDVFEEVAELVRLLHEELYYYLLLPLWRQKVKEFIRED